MMNNNRAEIWLKNRNKDILYSRIGLSMLHLNLEKQNNVEKKKEKKKRNGN